MPIQTNCKNCGRDYTVKDELAGKKFRCKDCQAPVVVPGVESTSNPQNSAAVRPVPPKPDRPALEDAPARSSTRQPSTQKSPSRQSQPQKKSLPARPVERKQTRPKPKPRPEPDEDLFGGSDELDDFDELSDDDFEDNFDDFAPAPRSKPKKSSKKKRSRKKSSSSNVGSILLKVGIGVFAGLALLIVLGLVIGGIRSGKFALPEMGASWKDYTTPDGAVTVSMPGTATKKPKPANVLAGGEVYGVEKYSYACMIIIEPLPPELSSMSDSEFIQATRTGLSMQGGTNMQETTVQGYAGLVFDRALPQGKSTSIAFVKSGKAYTITYAHRGSAGSTKDKFLKSIRVN